MRFGKVLSALLILSVTLPVAAQAPACSKANRIVRASVVALDQPIWLNRIGATLPEGMVFALAGDVVPITGSTLGPGNARLRDGKRPRPIVLRVNQYDCLQITFTNYLSLQPVNPSTSNPQLPPLQTATRNASVHVNGMQVYSLTDDGSWVGANAGNLAASSLAAPGTTKTYNLFATEQGTFLLYSMGAVFGGSNTPNGGAQQSEGLFGAVHVEPPDAEWYRSQVTKADLDASWTITPGGRVLNYLATMPSGKPILRMYTSNSNDTVRDIVYTDLTAVITGRSHGKFNPTLYPCNDPNGPQCGTAGTNPNFSLNYAEPERTEPYREFTIIYHELMEVTQAFTDFNTGVMGTQSGTNGVGTLTPIADQFAINYGTGGIGAEILSNRIGVGPMGGCPDCKYEEFFLDSWAVGDPAMIVDRPANGPCTVGTLYQSGVDFTTTCTPAQGTISNGLMNPNRKATMAYYPDDPSNVYHSYLNDHVKFRILHGGTGFSHVHHQHAHQWLRTPNNNESTYLDSQLINPGSAYTLEITFGGSGNRNNTPGDSIFHCHFYPHFAGGMWSLWRVHDTFEPGTTLASPGNPRDTRVAPGYSRALPDAEILAGTPTPAIVPLPTKAMAPTPAAVKLVNVVDPGNASRVIGTRVQLDPADQAAGKNPGYPFFIPGISGVRAPHPPMDFAVLPPAEGGVLDGGLPRHLLLTGTIANEQHTRYDWSKDLGDINAFKLPEGGTDVERIAMSFHSKCNHSTLTPEGQSALFETNGLPPAPGAPYADPALVPFNPNKPPPGDERCKPNTDFKRYRAAVFQTDLVFNKQGWHYPQSRMLALWEDVMPTLSGDRPPEPLFFRADTDDAIEYWHTNLVPDYYQLDDFQVRTPTDIIGQHIHLVKFDVTSSDGASNGWNYEDGTFSPDEVRDRINSINRCKGLSESFDKISTCGHDAYRTILSPKPPPSGICATNCPSSWTGAQTTVQRWMADPLKSPAEDPKIDRTLRTVFTHDHFGPSTHQQTGLYAAFIIEPPSTQWFMNETGQKMYTRKDGGPTSWQAVITAPPNQPAAERNTYREFAIAVQDFQLTYANDSISQAAPFDPPNNQYGWADPTHVLNMTNNLGNTVAGFAQQGVSAGPTQGTYTFNYRNEPLPFRLQKGIATNDQRATDPSYAFASNVPRNNPQANPQPTGGAAINPANPGGFKFPKNPLSFDMRSGDPYTPLLRAYENDKVQLRVIVGAHMLPHPFTIQGLKWLFEPGDSLVDPSEKSRANSGYRSNQAMGISEHFEFVLRLPRTAAQQNGFTDYLYMPDSSNPPGGRGIVDGTWGLLRAYQTRQSNLMALPDNPPPATSPIPPAAGQPWWWAANCGTGNTKTFTVYAQNTSLTLNSRNSLTLPNALVYTTTSSPGTVTEPLILRANAGDCIQITLNNNFQTTSQAFTATNSYPYNSAFNTPSTVAPLFKISPSKRAGLNPALLAYDVATSSGTNIGMNATEATVASGSNRTYYWYAGDIDPANGRGTPIEFGAVNLTPSDPLQQDTYGLIGALVIEPKGATFTAASSSSAASGTVTDATGRLLFQEFVLVTQDNLSGTSGTNASQIALNYRQEPMTPRFNNASNLNAIDLSPAVSNTLVGGDPLTPIFNAKAGNPVRIHLFHPGGSSDQQVLTLHGHLWQDEPYLNGSTVIGINSESPWIGSRDLYGTNSAYTLVLPSAGGANKVPGDYLYRTHPANFFGLGLWGILRVQQ